MAEKKEFPELEILKDFYVIDRLYVERKDPNYVYRWLRDQNINISLKTSNDPQIGFWKICQPEDLDEMKVDPKLRSADGLLRRGDLILARMPRPVYERKTEIRTERTKALEASVSQTLREGIPEKGIQTKKQLGIK